MLATTDERRLVIVIALTGVQPIAGLQCPPTGGVDRQHQMVPGMGRLRSQIARPAIVGIVGECLQLKLRRRLPVESHVNATLVLHTAAIAETASVECRVAITIKALQRHQAQPVA